MTVREVVTGWVLTITLLGTCGTPLPYPQGPFKTKADCLVYKRDWQRVYWFIAVAGIEAHRRLAFRVGDCVGSDDPKAPFPTKKDELYLLDDWWEWEYDDLGKRLRRRVQ